MISIRLIYLDHIIITLATIYPLLNLLICVVATTYHKGQIISLTSKPQSRSIMWVFTRELDKESLLN